MPNWAHGSVEITGIRSNVESFIARFIPHEGKPMAGRRFFARSFNNMGETELSQVLQQAFEDHAEGEEATVCISVSFAWSAYSCVIDGYPQNDPERCITLSDACMEDRVSVVIRTTEYGMSFTESISCDAAGVLTVSTKDLSHARCKRCGHVEEMTLLDAPEEVECECCGNIGFEMIIEEEN